MREWAEDRILAPFRPTLEEVICTTKTPGLCFNNRGTYFVISWMLRPWRGDT